MLSCKFIGSEKKNKRSKKLYKIALKSVGAQRYGNIEQVKVAFLNSTGIESEGRKSTMMAALLYGSAETIRFSAEEIGML
jgi:hypothetical protein